MGFNKIIDKWQRWNLTEGRPPPPPPLTLRMKELGSKAQRKEIVQLSNLKVVK